MHRQTALLHCEAAAEAAQSSACVTFQPLNLSLNVSASCWRVCVECPATLDSIGLQGRPHLEIAQLVSCQLARGDVLWLLLLLLGRVC